LFRDDTVDDWRDLDIEIGDVLHHQNFDTGEAALYNIRDVTQYYLKASAKQAFPDARPKALRLDENGDQALFVDGVTTFATSTIVSASAAGADFTQEDIGKYVRITDSGTLTAIGDYQITAVDEALDTATLLPLLVTTILGDNAGVEFYLYEDLVVYSIGDVGPSYGNKVALATTGKFTRDYQEVGRVLLPGEPVYLIREVSVLDPTDPDANALTGRVIFPNRVNVEPSVQAGDNLEYRVEVINELEHQSSRQMAVIDVGFEVEQIGANAALNNSNRLTAPGAIFTANDVGKRIFILDSVLQNNRGEFEIDAFIGPNVVDLIDPNDGGWASVAEIRLSWQLSNKHKYDGKTMRVVYDTIVNFDVVDEFVSQRNRRVICADTLTRGFHPVYLEMELIYRIAEDAIAVPDENEVIAFVSEFINTFPTNDVIHASDVVTAVQSTFEDIGSIRLPLTITYELHAPDGRIIPYVTRDAVSIDQAFLASSDDADRLEDPEALGATDSSVRYLSDETLITMTLVE